MSLFPLFKTKNPRGLAGQKAAVVLKYQDRILMYPEHMTANGHVVIAGPWTILSPEIDDEELGREVFAVLKSSRKNVSQPDNPGRVAKERLRAAGVRSEQEFSMGVLAVSIRVEGESIVVTPLREPPTGLKPVEKPALDDRRLLIELDVPDDLAGRRIKRAWQSCVTA